MRRDRQWIGGQVEDAAEPRDDAGQRGEPGEVDRGAQGMSRGGLNARDPVLSVELDGACVTVLVRALDARDGAEAEKLQHGRPVVGGLVAQEQADLAPGAGWDLGHSAAPE